MKIVITCELDDSFWGFPSDASDETILDGVAEDIPALLTGADFEVVRTSAPKNDLFRELSELAPKIIASTQSEAEKHHRRVEKAQKRIARAVESQAGALASLTDMLEGAVKIAAGLNGVRS